MISLWRYHSCQLQTFGQLLCRTPPQLTTLPFFKDLIPWALSINLKLSFFDMHINFQSKRSPVKYFLKNQWWRSIVRSLLTNNVIFTRSATQNSCNVCCAAFLIGFHSVVLWSAACLIKHMHPYWSCVSISNRFLALAKSCSSSPLSFLFHITLGGDEINLSLS